MFLASKKYIHNLPTGIRGFGLVELMVSITIMMLLSSIILVRNSSFNGAVLLRSQAYEVAFALRQMQLLAVSGNNVGAQTPTTVQQYGVYFDTASGSEQMYILFHDVDASGQWDAGVDTQIGPVGRLDKRFKISAISDVSGTSVTGGGTGYSVTFVRPNFDAKFNDTVDSGYENTSPIYIDIAQINAESDDKSIGQIRRVEISNTGQISVTSFP